MVVLPLGCNSEEGPVTTTSPPASTPTYGTGTNQTPSGGTPPPARTTTQPVDNPTTVEPGKGAQGTAQPETKSTGDQPKVIDKPAEPTPSDKQAEPKAEQQDEPKAEQKKD